MQLARGESLRLRMPAGVAVQIGGGSAIFDPLIGGFAALSAKLS
jgi:hypothetical protein